MKLDVTEVEAIAAGLMPFLETGYVPTQIGEKLAQELKTRQKRDYIVRCHNVEGGVQFRVMDPAESWSHLFTLPRVASENKAILQPNLETRVEKEERPTIERQAPKKKKR